VRSAVHRSVVALGAGVLLAGAGCALLETQQSFALAADAGTGAQHHDGGSAGDATVADAKTADARHSDARARDSGQPGNEGGVGGCDSGGFCDNFDEYPSGADAAVMNGRWNPGVGIVGAASIELSTTHAKSPPNSLHITVPPADGGLGGYLTEKLVLTASVTGVVCEFDAWIDPPSPATASAYLFGETLAGFGSSVASTDIEVQSNDLRAIAYLTDGSFVPTTANIQNVPSDQWLHYTVRAATTPFDDAGDTVRTSVSVGSSTEVAAVGATFASDITGVTVMFTLNELYPGGSSMDVYFDNLVCTVTTQ